MNKKWLVVRWPEVNAEILVVFDKADLKVAVEAHPGKVIFMLPELREMEKYADDKKAIRAAYYAKKVFGGWVVPTKEKNIEAEGDIAHRR